jgi:hypothetical protein
MSPGAAESVQTCSRWCSTLSPLICSREIRDAASAARTRRRQSIASNVIGVPKGSAFSGFNGLYEADRRRARANYKPRSDCPLIMTAVSKRERKIRRRVQSEERRDETNYCAPSSTATIPEIVFRPVYRRERCAGLARRSWGRHPGCLCSHPGWNERVERLPMSLL